MLEIVVVAVKELGRLIALVLERYNPSQNVVQSGFSGLPHLDETANQPIIGRTRALCQLERKACEAQVLLAEASNHDFMGDIGLLGIGQLFFQV